MVLVRVLCLTAALLAAASIVAHAQETTPIGRDLDASQPVLLSADQVTRDDELGIVTATGNVELAQGDRIILADTLTFNERDNIVSANGNVTILEPTGEVLFADYVELKDDLREGVILALGVRLTDGARMAASSAQRTGGNRTVMNRAVYSPCELCPTDRARAPLWQVKAKEVVHDQTTHDIAYYDAWLEFFGVPIAYTPYFEHADPTVKRRSGFLSPIYGSSSTLGYILTAPYYVVLAPWRDLTIEPTITTNEGPVLGLQYRERTTIGDFEFAGSITRPETQDEEFGTTLGNEVIRGHIVGTGEFQINSLWRTGFQLERASDATYVSRYRVAKLSGRRTLVTRPYAEMFDDRDYAAVTAYYFQGLDEGDVQSRTPFVLPFVDINLASAPAANGSFFTFDGNGMALHRREGADSRRLSLIGGWHLPVIGSIGDVYKLSTTLRGDIYDVSDVVDPDDARIVENGLTGRFVPELSLEWRYPLLARYGETRSMIEPIIQAIASPYGGNPESIPNEDSQDLEFDDSNVFSSSRFSGLDRIEIGPRVNYGVRFGFYEPSGGQATALFGQTYRLKQDDALTNQSGLDSNLSDYVGRIFITPADYLDLGYRFRLDSEDLSLHRSELDVSGGPSFLRLSVSYLQLEGQATADNQSGFANREEVVLGAFARFTSNWSVQASTRRDLTGDGRTLSIDGALTYEDECFLASLIAAQSFTETRDVEQDTSFFFRVIFKGLS